MKELNFIDLFCGCGGFSNGLEQAGHKCLLGVDFDKNAIESFLANHRDAQAICGDISKLTEARLKKLVDIESIDLIVGGPPCQGFSTVGKGQVEDQRNSLFKEFLRIVRIVRPQFVVFENVTGMLAKKNEKIFSKIVASFNRMGFSVDAKVMSAEEYGVPSKRRRTIIIASKDVAVDFPKVTHGVSSSRSAVTVERAFKKLSRLKHLHNHELNLSEVRKEQDKQRLKYLPPGSGIRYPKDEKLLPKKLRFNIDWSSLPEGRFRQTKLQRIPLKDVAPTILTSKSTYYHPTEPRYLTAREAASLQSFPHNFVFKGSVTAQFRQIGNAVPPLLAKAIGEELKQVKLALAPREKLSCDSIRSKAFSYRN